MNLLHKITLGTVLAAAGLFLAPERAEAGWGGSITISTGGGYCGPSYSVSRYSGYHPRRAYVNTGYYAPRRTYYRPRATYCAPRPVYYHAPRPVYVSPPRIIYRARACY